MLAKETRSEEEDFYPRSPCGERRNGCQADPAGQHFYPRSPCGERPQRARTPAWNFRISIHALLAESDGLVGGCDNVHYSFLSTLSLRRATLSNHQSVNYTLISIHALLAESDADCPSITVLHCNFYPRSPCGERQPSVNVKSSP